MRAIVLLVVIKFCFFHQKAVVGTYPVLLPLLPEFHCLFLQRQSNVQMYNPTPPWMVFATAVKPNTTKLLTIQCKNRMITPMTEVNNATNSKSFSTLQFREKPRQEKQMFKECYWNLRSFCLTMEGLLSGTTRKKGEVCLSIFCVFLRISPLIPFLIW